MPYSDAEGKPTIHEWIRAIEPANVVDIGPGEGTYAILARDRNSLTFWTAVEIWGPYVNRFGLEALYDEVIIADARRVDPEVYRADLVIAGDVLEHMSRSQAQTLVRTIQARADHLIVSIPVLHLEQGPWEGNPFEVHRHEQHWRADDMRSMLAEHPHGRITAEQVGSTLAAYWWTRTIA